MILQALKAMKYKYTKDDRLFASPTFDFCLAGDHVGVKRDTIYKVEHAKNQPDWEARGLVFFPLPAGASSSHMLLARPDYTLVTPVLVNEIGATTLLEFYEGHPERWCQGWWGRVRPDGYYVSGNDEACALCIGAAMGFIYYKGVGTLNNLDAPEGRLFRTLFPDEVRRMGFEDSFEAWKHRPWMMAWNDAPERTHEDVVQACREARI